VKITCDNLLCVLSYILKMASKKRKAPSTPTQSRFDRSRFTSQEAWERYTDIVVPWKILPERNVILHHTKFDEFTEELERRNWHKELTNFVDGSIDVAIVKEFYANLYDPKDKPPKQVRVRGPLVKFDADTLNSFLKTPVILEEGENFPVYSRFCRSKLEPQEPVARLCIPGKGWTVIKDLTEESYHALLDMECSIFL